ncbi:MAG: YraN family protein [Ndongobacter sp.]|nr:YraN family protein [Ndongobacter sp.]
MMNSRNKAPVLHRTAADSGRAGEELAARYVQERHFTIIERNYRTRCGEWDLIAKKGQLLVFIEVKARSSFQFGQPHEFVDRTKRKRLRRAADIYLQARNALHQPIRFDIIEVDLTRRTIRWLPNAFGEE